MATHRMDWQTPNAAPSQSEVTTADTERTWGRSAEGQLRSLGISPVDDELAAQIAAAQEKAVEQLKARQAADMDEQLHDFRRQWDRGQTDPTSIYYRADPAMKERMEADMMLARLEAGLPAEPAPRKTPAQLAQERYDARHKAAG
jgi:hypothetical protein